MTTIIPADVRLHFGNLTMTYHPIYLHGHEFIVTGVDGGPTFRRTRNYEVTTDVAVGQMRQFEIRGGEDFVIFLCWSIVVSHRCNFLTDVKDYGFCETKR